MQINTLVQAALDWLGLRLKHRCFLRLSQYPLGECLDWFSAQSKGLGKDDAEGLVDGFSIGPRSDQAALCQLGCNVKARHQDDTEAGQCSLDQHCMKIVARTHRRIRQQDPGFLGITFPGIWVLPPMQTW